MKIVVTFIVSAESVDMPVRSKCESDAHGRWDYFKSKHRKGLKYTAGEHASTISVQRICVELHGSRGGEEGSQGGLGKVGRQCPILI